MITKKFEEEMGRKAQMAHRTTRSMMKKWTSPNEKRQKFTPEQIQYLCDNKTIEEWVGYTLRQRCKAFEMKFPDTKMTLYHLTKIYREVGIRKKKIRKTKIVDLGRQQHIKEEAVKAHEQLTSLR